MTTHEFQLARPNAMCVVISGGTELHVHMDNFGRYYAIMNGDESNRLYPDSVFRPPGFKLACSLRQFLVEQDLTYWLPDLDDEAGPSNFDLNECKAVLMDVIKQRAEAVEASVKSIDWRSELGYRPDDSTLIALRPFSSLQAAWINHKAWAWKLRHLERCLDGEALTALHNVVAKWYGLVADLCFYELRDRGSHGVIKTYSQLDHDSVDQDGNEARTIEGLCKVFKAFARLCADKHPSARDDVDATVKAFLHSRFNEVVLYHYPTAPKYCGQGRLV